MLNDGWVTVQGARGHSDRNPSVCHSYTTTLSAEAASRLQLDAEHSAASPNWSEHKAALLSR